MACPYDTNNLQQGLLLRTKKKELIKQDSPNFALLEETTGPKLGSIVEGLDDPNSALSRPLPGAGSTPMDDTQNIAATLPSSPTHKAYKPDVTKVKALEDQFNKILAEYTTLFKSMIEELMINNNRPELQKFAGKNVKHDNNYYHVNNYGFAHVFDNEAWKSRSSSCVGDPVDITSAEFENLLSGPNMGNGQACKVAGYNIHNSTSGEQSWVDIKGVRHVYPDSNTDRHPSCQGQPRTLTDEEYKSIPEGTKMDSNMICTALNVNPSIIKNLEKLNNELQTLGNKLLQDTTNMISGNDHLQSEITDVHNNMVATLKRLEGDKFNLTQGKINMGHSGVQLNQAAYNTNLEGAKRSSELFLRMNYLRYLIGMILVIFLVIFSLTNYSSNEKSNIANGILIIVILVVLYKFWSFISSKLF